MHTPRSITAAAGAALILSTVGLTSLAQTQSQPGTPSQPARQQNPQPRPQEPGAPGQDRQNPNQSQPNQPGQNQPGQTQPGQQDRNNPNRPVDPNDPNRNNPNRPFDPNNPNRDTRDPNRAPGQNDFRIQSPFSFSSPQAESQFRDQSRQLLRMEQRLQQNNEQLLRRLGEARQLSGERQNAAVMDLLQQFLLEQQQMQQYLVQARTMYTGDLSGMMDGQTPGQTPGQSPSQSPVQSPGDRLDPNNPNRGNPNSPNDNPDQDRNRPGTQSPDRSNPSNPGSTPRESQPRSPR